MILKARARYYANSSVLQSLQSVDMCFENCIPQYNTVKKVRVYNSA